MKSEKSLNLHLGCAVVMLSWKCCIEDAVVCGRRGDSFSDESTKNVGDLLHKTYIHTYIDNRYL